MEGMDMGKSMGGVMEMNDTMHGGHGMDGSMMSMMMMSMTFHNKLPFHLLFENTEIKSKTDLFVAGVLMFFLGIVYEYIKSLRLRILDPECCSLMCCTCPKKRSKTGKKCVTKLQKKTSTCCNSDDISESYVTSVDVSDDDDEFQNDTGKNKKRAISVHLLETALHGVQLIFSYVIMLAVMTYNVWIVFSVVVGSIVGYLACNWPTSGKRRRNSRRKMIVRNTDCH